MEIDAFKPFMEKVVSDVYKNAPNLESKLQFNLVFFSEQPSVNKIINRRHRECETHMAAVSRHKDEVAKTSEK